MRVMAFASQKGGSGKTTLAGHIAVQAERAGAGPVAIVDTDPQGSLSDWWNARQAPTPVFAQTFISRLAQDLQKMRDIGIEILIFDTPPAITATIDQVIRVCDLVVIPTHPSPHDLRAAGATVDIVENLDKSLVFVLNGATPRARITAEATRKAAWPTGGTRVRRKRRSSRKPSYPASPRICRRCAISASRS